MKKEEIETTIQRVPRTAGREGKPTAEIAIRGIALLWFSKASDSAVLGFLSVVRHELLMEIRKTDGSLDTHLIPRGATVVFNSRNPGKGDTQSSGDDKDFKHLIDLTAIHGFPVSVKNKFFAKFFINNATFSTLQRSKYDVQLREIGGNGITKRLPKVGKIAGASIYDNNFNILINGSPLNLNDYKTPYEITLQYQCPKRFIDKPVSDFKFVYDTVNVADNRKYNLHYDDDEPVEFTASDVNSTRHFLAQIENILISRENILEDEKEKILYEIEILRRRISCEVACQIVTLGEEVVVSEET